MITPVYEVSNHMDVKIAGFYYRVSMGSETQW